MSTIDDQSLGRFHPVDLRTIWASEPAGFTPWLAQQENLAVLSETLGLDLELVTVEKEVGSFRADIVCRDIATEALVLIENQLEQTDHNHLDKLLTYAAGLQAVTVVWLADRFRDEHRATLDWLNEITHQDSRFFGLEIELWRIGDSPAAPKFNIVSMPNDWSRSVAQSARATDDAELSELKLMQKEYWTALHHRLNKIGGPIRGNRKPKPQAGMSYPIGVAGFRVQAAMHTYEKYVRVSLYIMGMDVAEERLAILEQKKNEIEQKLGYPLEWGDQKSGASERRVSYYLRDADPKDESDWPRQHEWLVEHLNKMHRAFEQQVGDL